MTRFIDQYQGKTPYNLVVFDGLGNCGIDLTPRMRSRIIPIAGRGPFVRAWNLLVFLAHHRRDIIISSTWKMAVLVLVARIFARLRYHWSFTHRSSSAGVIDRNVRRWQVRHSTMRFADSAAAAAWIRAQGVTDNVVELPLIFNVPHAGEARGMMALPVRVCFFGRLSPVKNLPTVFSFIDGLARRGVETVFDIYGPDDGKLHEVQAWLKSSAPANLLRRYLGPVAPKDAASTIGRYHFLISCSFTEGFALSVAESMQLGVVPIVGNVGGPSTYCTAENAVILQDYSSESLDRAVNEVVNIVQSPDTYARLSEGAAATFAVDEGFVEQYSRVLERAVLSMSEPAVTARRGME